MRQAREIIRLKAASVSAHEISRRLGMPRSTVREALERAEGAGLCWPLPEGMNDEALEAALYANRRSKRGHRRVEEPDWAGVHRELKRKHVTLTILWDEYIAENPGGYRYSRFCELYRAFEKTLSVTMRQTHAAGERLFVDYARRRRQAHRRSAHGADIRRGAGRVEPHIRESELDADAS
jgi:transposase